VRLREDGDANNSSEQWNTKEMMMDIEEDVHFIDVKKTS